MTGFPPGYRPPPSEGPGDRLKRLRGRRIVEDFEKELQRIAGTPTTIIAERKLP